MELNEVALHLLKHIAEKGATSVAVFVEANPWASQEDTRQAARILIQRGLVATGGTKKDPKYSIVRLEDLALLAFELTDSEQREKKKGAATVAFAQEARERNRIKLALARAKNLARTLKKQLDRSEERLEMWGNGEVPAISAEEEFKGIIQMSIDFPTRAEEKAKEAEAKKEAKEQAQDAQERPEFDDLPESADGKNERLYELPKAL